jgi:hypothetical protein
LKTKVFAPAIMPELTMAASNGLLIENKVQQLSSPAMLVVASAVIKMQAHLSQLPLAYLE